MTKSLEDRIRERAYELWEQEGRIHGKADEHWLKASLEVIGALAGEELTQTSSPTTPGTGARQAGSPPSDAGEAKEAQKPRRRASSKKAAEKHAAEPKPAGRSRKRPQT